MLFHKRI